MKNRSRKEFDEKSITVQNKCFLRNTACFAANGYI
jgi:hypothetical protein